MSIFLYNLHKYLQGNCWKTYNSLVDIKAVFITFYQFITNSALEKDAISLLN